MSQAHPGYLTRCQQSTTAGLGVVICSPVFKPGPSHVGVFLIHSELEVCHVQVHVTSCVQAACTGSDHYDANRSGVPNGFSVTLYMASCNVQVLTIRTCLFECVQLFAHL